MGDDVPAPAGSALAGLRAARKKALDGLTVDLKVPGYEPDLYVRFRPIKQRELDLANEKAAASKEADRIVVANAVVLSHACLGVFGIVDGKPEGDPSSWPRFDEELAKALGLMDNGENVPPVTDIVRALYLTDGPLIGAAEALNAWSAPAVQRREDELAGN